MGRRSDNDLVFDPKRDLLVSGHHAEIRLADGQTTIVDLGSKNGTYVNGERIRAPLPLMPGDRIELGLDGPEFRIELVAAASAGDTQLPDSLERRAAPQRVRPEDPTPPPSSLLRAPDGVAFDATPKQPAKPAKPKSRIAIVVVVLSIAVAAAAAFVLSRDGEGTPAPAPATDRPDVTIDHHAALYTVLLRSTSDGNGTEQVVGAAFSLAPGRLGTSGRIATLLARDAENGRVIVRDAAGLELRVTQARPHPGYTAFATAIARYSPFDVDHGKFWCSAERLAAVPEANRELVPTGVAPAACDVGVLGLDASDVGRQAPPLRLADAERLSGLAGGESLIAWGHATDSRASGNTATGRLTRTCNVVFGTPRSDGDALRIESSLSYSAALEGGPLCDAAGNVVGIVAHHSPVSGTGESCFATRCDVLAELQSESVESVQASRAAAWESMLQLAFEQGMQDGRALALRVASRSLAIPLSEVAIEEEWAYSLSDDHVTGDFAVITSTAARFVICAFASQLPTPIDLEVGRAGKFETVRGELVAPPYFVVAALGSLPSGERFDVRARCRDAADASRSRVVFFVLRAAPVK